MTVSLKRPCPQNARAFSFAITSICRKILPAVVLFFYSFAVTAMDTLSLRVGDQTLELEIARTEAERERGLMGRCELAENTGMAFFFDPPESVGFWMKNTLINLDIAFVDEAGYVFHTDTMRANSLTLHHSYGLVSVAIELPQGTLRRLRIGPGTYFPELDRKKKGATPSTSATERLRSH